MSNISTSSVSAATSSGISSEISTKSSVQNNFSKVTSTGYGNGSTGDEFVSSSGKQYVMDNETYNALYSSSASQTYKTTAAASSSGYQLSKINKSAKCDFAYFSSFSKNSSGYSDLKDFAEELGNSHITSLIKEFETTRSLLGISSEELFESC